MKRHVNELEKQGFVKRIKRFDDSGRQRSNIYQLRLPSDSHIQQADLGQTDSDRQAHIIFHKEHKTELNLKNGIVDAANVLNTPNSSEEPDTSTSKTKTKNEAVIDLLTKEGSAPIYHEFYEILKRTYPKLDVLQELHAMQAW